MEEQEVMNTYAGCSSEITTLWLKECPTLEPRRSPDVSPAGTFTKGSGWVKSSRRSIMADR